MNTRIRLDDIRSAGRLDISSDEVRCERIALLSIKMPPEGGILEGDSWPGV
jgi:hypothetical protein